MAEGWQEVTPLETEDRPARRRVDVVALVAGIAFSVLAVGGLVGITTPVDLLAGGGLLWGVLVGAGVALLVSELRRARRGGGGPPG